MGNTSIYGLPYQGADDPPNGPLLGQALAEAVEVELERIDEVPTYRPEIRKARVKGAGSTIATAEAVEQTCPITIPATWSTYDIEVQVYVRCLETGAASGNTTITLRIRKTNTGGAQWGQTALVVADALPSNLGVGTFAGYAEGETATGTFDVAFTAVAGSNNGLISWTDLTMFVTAVRTS